MVYEGICKLSLCPGAVIAIAANRLEHTLDIRRTRTQNCAATLVTSHKGILSSPVLLATLDVQSFEKGLSHNVWSFEIELDSFKIFL